MIVNYNKYNNYNNYYISTIVNIGNETIQTKYLSTITIILFNYSLVFQMEMVGYCMAFSIVYIGFQTFEIPYGIMHH